MSDDFPDLRSPGSPTPRDATEVRFGMRAMLMVMAAVAVVTTALGAFVRHFPKDVQLRLSVFWGILAVILAGLIAFHARRRYVAERQAGRVLFLLAPHSYFIPRAPGFARAVAGALLLAVAPAVWIVGSFEIAYGDLWSVWFHPSGIINTINGLIATGTGVTILWWRHVRLAEKGIVLRSRFIPWGGGLRWYWDACNKDVIVLESPKFKRVAAKVPNADRKAVDMLLTERCTEHTRALRSF